MGRWLQQPMNGSRADEMGIEKGEESRATRTGPDRTSTTHADDIIHQRASVHRGDPPDHPIGHSPYSVYLHHLHRLD